MSPLDWVIDFGQKHKGHSLREVLVTDEPYTVYILSHAGFRRQHAAEWAALRLAYAQRVVAEET